TAELTSYFPARMRSDFAADIRSHRLRREIIVTQLANAMINRGGPTYLTRVADQTGADVAATARAFAAVRSVFDLDALDQEIDALDGKVAGAAQLRLYRAAQDLLLSETVWFLRNVDFADGVAVTVGRFAPAVTAVEKTLATALPEKLAAQLHHDTEA